MKKVLICIYLIIIAFFLLAQDPPEVIWTNTFGGINSDIGADVVQTSDQGFIIAGTTYSFGSGSGDAWLIKTNSEGGYEWEQLYGDTGTEVIYEIVQTLDGGYAIVGTCSEGANDVWLLKVDEDGFYEWDQTYGSPIGSEFAYTVQQTADGGFIVGGCIYPPGISESDAWLIKTDEFGNAEWDETYGGEYGEVVFSVKETSDGGFIFCGYTYSYGAGEWDFWLVKTDGNGILQWDQTYGDNSLDWAYSVIESEDGGYITTGFVSPQGGGPYDVLIVKVDVNGNLDWDQTYGEEGTDIASSIIQTDDGEYLIVGQTSSFNADGIDILLLKIDENGDEIWLKICGGSSTDTGISVIQTFDGGYVVVGSTVSYGQGLNDIWLVRLESDTFADSNIIPADLSLLHNYPNPFNPITTISYQLPEIRQVELSIYNIRGQLVKTLVNVINPAGEYAVVWNGDDNNQRNVPSGVYLYRLCLHPDSSGKTKENSQIKKMILLR